MLIKQTSIPYKTCWECRVNDYRPTGKRDKTIEWDDGDKIGNKNKCFHLFRSSSSSFSFCFSNHRGAVFFFLLLSLPSSFLQWHHEEDNFFLKYDQTIWLFNCYYYYYYYCYCYYFFYYNYYICCLLTGPWTYGIYPYVLLINCRYHLFRSSASSFYSKYRLLFLKSLRSCVILLPTPCYQTENFIWLWKSANIIGVGCGNYHPVLLLSVSFSRDDAVRQYWLRLTNYMNNVWRQIGVVFTVNRPLILITKVSVCFAIKAPLFTVWICGFPREPVVVQPLPQLATFLLIFPFIYRS